MNKKSLKGTIFLLIGSMIWGSAFVAQNVGMDYVGPYTFNGLRFLIGTLTLLPVIIVTDLIKKKSPMLFRKPPSSFVPNAKRQ